MTIFSRLNFISRFSKIFIIFFSIFCDTMHRRWSIFNSRPIRTMWKAIFCSVLSITMAMESRKTTRWRWSILIWPRSWATYSAIIIWRRCMRRARECSALAWPLRSCIRVWLSAAKRRICSWRRMRPTRKMMWNVRWLSTFFWPSSATRSRRAMWLLFSIKVISRKKNILVKS